MEGVYCHWDGYVSHNGRILKEHYSERKKLAKLIAGGDISSLGPDIGSKHDFDARPEGETTFYHRDRSEGWESVRPQCFNSWVALLNHAGNCGCEYVYLFDGTDWQYAARRAQYFGMSDGTPFSYFKPLPNTFEA
ncbi:hypothetical protein KFU94_00450 [Chloroflexi bacterium TSY]|nr:hypothetical protein [Chloroflexi bacterium TSY]